MDPSVTVMDVAAYALELAGPIHQGPWLSIETVNSLNSFYYMAPREAILGIVYAYQNR